MMPKSFSSFLKKDQRGIAPLVVIGFLGISALAAWWTGKTISQGMKDVAEGLLWGIGNLLFYVFREFCYQVTALFDEAVKILDKSITTDPNFIMGWTSIRDISNMMIVLGFVLVGIATTLRIRDYEAKKLLVPLILIALLINFSGLFCGLIIDASHILMKTFLPQGGAGGYGWQMYWTVDKAADTIFQSTEYTQADIQAAFLYVWGATLMFLMVGITFLYLSFILVARYAALAFLYILAPLAFVCKIFPATQKLWSMWWENFIKWSFIGVGASFFIWLSYKFLEEMTTGGRVDTSKLMMVLIFLFVGVKITTKSSAMGAGAVMGLAGGALGYLQGAAVGAGKGTLKGLSNSRAGQATQRGLTRAGEWTRLVAPGTANLMRQEQQKEHDSEKRAGTWTAEQRKDIATGRRPMTKRGRDDKVEAAKQMALKGELGGLTQDERDKVMRYATSHGVPASVLAKGDYRAAEYDRGRVDKVMTARGLTGPTGEAAAKAIVRQEQLQQNLPSMTDEQRRNINHADIDGPTNYDFVKENFTPHMISQLQTAQDPLLRSGMRGHLAQLNTDIGRATSAAEATRLRKLHDAIDKYC